MAYTFISVLHVYCSLLLHRWERLRSVVMSMSACLSVCEDISGTTRAIFTKFLCVLPMTVAQSSSGPLTVGRIAYRREVGERECTAGAKCNLRLPCSSFCLVPCVRLKALCLCCILLSFCILFLCISISVFRCF